MTNIISSLGIFISLIGIIISISTLFTLQQQFGLSSKDVEARNRPYLEITSPAFNFYNKDKDLLNYPIISGSQPEYAKLKFSAINHGVIPAEIITQTLEIIGFSSIASTSTNITIYKSYDYQTNEVSGNELQYVLDNLQSTNGFQINVRLQYKIYGTNKIFEARNHSRCVSQSVGKSINCEPISSGTN